jgi:hypothetical protein
MPPYRIIPSNEEPIFISKYSTRLSPDKQDGLPLLPNHYRILVEEQREGNYG